MAHNATELEQVRPARANLTQVPSLIIFMGQRTPHSIPRPIVFVLWFIYNYVSLEFFCLVKPKPSFGNQKLGYVVEKKKTG